MSPTEPAIAGRHASPVFELTGGRLALDFANTVDHRPADRRRDLLQEYADLVAWGRQAGVLAAEEADELLRAARRRPAAARDALRRATALREGLYGIFAALADGRTPDAADVALLERHVREAWRRARLVRGRPGYRWEWERAAGALDRVVWPVARDAADLLVAGEVGRVRECRADDCAWLFVDVSRNRSRVWCDMKVCGNREKARRHYARRRKG